MHTLVNMNPNFLDISKNKTTSSVSKDKVSLI